MATAPEVQKTDRSTWGSGPWDGEPDRVDFQTLGYPCLLKRAPLGHWCGYVAVPPGHPLHGVGYDEVERRVPGLDVHGGLTYSAACAGEICHVPAPGEPDNVWWLGFDCAHAGDLSPRFRMLDESRPETAIFARLAFSGDVYRTVDYVARETEKLAAQIFQYTTDARRAVTPADGAR